MRTRSSRTGALLPVIAAALLTSGCDSGPAGPQAKQAPRAAALSSGASCSAPDVHTKHVNLFACTTCHPSGAAYGFDVPYTFAGGTTTAGGTIVLRTATSPTTCSVACHFPKGAAPHAVAWDAPGPLVCTECHAAALPASHPAVPANASRADCQACHLAASHMDGAVALVGHPPAWTAPADPANAQFHASAANRGIGECQKCHGQALTGGPTGVSCARCHDVNLPAGVASWTVHCTMCHGGAETAGGAPPKATWGNASDAIRVGAHTRHVSGSAIAPAFDCDACHVKPASALAAGHLDGTVADVRFAGLAVAGGAAPSWNRGAGTCASTYCHGATLSGGTLETPSWTVLDGTQAACGTCHGTPPGGSHPPVSGGLVACNPCHPATMDPAGGIIPPASGGRHLDGAIQAAGHPAEWTNPASGGFHAFAANQGLDGCRSCHGATLAGGSAPTACARCHDTNLPAGIASWRVNCTMCHGGTNDATGAPPRAIWGFAGDPSRGGGTGDPVRVGAHSAHVAGASSDGTLRSAPFDCGVCHVRPADALSSGHLDGTTATVTFSGLASQGVTPGPSWTRATAGCAGTYCHGASLHGGTNTAPSWTGGAGQVACGSCHGVPPPASTGHPQNTSCGNCHPGYSRTSVNPATHVNGTIEVSGLTCTSCHGDGQRAATALNPQLPVAPPTDTLGNTGTTSPGVGAHQAHLVDGPLRGALACTECHAVPASTAGHPDGTLGLVWGPLATRGGAAPTYSGGTCASTYCHGATAAANGTNQAPRWTGGASEAACGTCHGLPPGRPPSPVHPTYLYAAPCVGCHPGTTTVDATGDAIVPGGGHVNGTVEYTFAGHPPGWATATTPGGDHARQTCMGCFPAPGEYTMGDYYIGCTTCHGQSGDFTPSGGSSRVSCGACHPAFFDASGQTSCTFCH